MNISNLISDARTFALRYRTWWLPTGLSLLAVLFLFQGISKYKSDLGYGMDLKEVLVASSGLSEGHVLSEKDFSVMPLPAKFLPVGAMASSDRKKLVGRFLLRPIAKKEIILWSALEGSSTPFGPSSRISKGYRAIAIPVDSASSVSQTIRSGDRVDVITTVPVAENGGATTLTLLQNVGVLSVGEPTQDMNGSFSTVTLMVLPKEVNLLTFAQQQGKLFLVLRHPEDYQTPRDLPLISLTQLIETGFRNSIQKERNDTVEVIKGGKVSFEQIHP